VARKKRKEDQVLISREGVGKKARFHPDSQEKPKKKTSVSFEGTKSAEIKKRETAPKQTKRVQNQVLKRD